MTTERRLGYEVEVVEALSELPTLDDASEVAWLRVDGVDQRDQRRLHDEELALLGSIHEPLHQLDQRQVPAQAIHSVESILNAVQVYLSPLHKVLVE